MKRVLEENINPVPWSAKGGDSLEAQWNREDRIDQLNFLKNHIGNGDTILDVGVGGGREIRALREAEYDNKIDVCDYYQEVIDFLNTKNLDINGFTMDLRDEKLKLNKYDIIICFETVEHFDDPIAIIKKLLPFAKKKLIISVPHQMEMACEQHPWSIDVNDLKITDNCEVKKIDIGGTPHIFAVYYG